MAWEPKVVDRRGEALGGQSVDRPLSWITTIGWHYTATHDSFITNHERFWANTYGWDRGGYHAYIGRNGTIYINYDLTRITWGVANSNNFTVHMSLEALDANDYTPEQIRSREWLTRKWMKELNLPASAVKGHWEIYNNTACPGYTRAEMDNFRRQLAQAPIVLGAKTHKVQAGETLWALSQKYGMGVDKLKDLNDLDSNLIVVGQVLVVDGSAPLPAPVYKQPNLKPLDVVAKEVINGHWGNGDERKRKLEAAGYNYHDIQATVDRILLGSKSSLKPLEMVAEEVIAGKWGSGDERKRKLEAAGYSYSEVQNRVNQMLADNTPKTEYVQLSKHVSSWRVYPLGVAPIAGNEKGFLNPAKFGGLKYQVLGREDGGATAIIQTGDFGRGKIYLDTDATLIWE